jgi:hypothetical protein
VIAVGDLAPQPLVRQYEAREWRAANFPKGEHPVSQVRMLVAVLRSGIIINIHPFNELRPQPARFPFSEKPFTRSGNSLAARNHLQTKHFRQPTNRHHRLPTAAALPFQWNYMH